ncbi:hypothetical protein V2J09_021182 [Rumex salicifolius]
MKLLHSIYGHHRSLLRALGRRQFTAESEAYLKRNYAKNSSEYNTVISSLAAKRRHYLLRDVYDDMVLDGVQPTRDVFHSLIVGTMKGARLQDAFFFTDSMKAMGLSPDLALYNFLISTCGKCKISEQAILLLEEMNRNEVKPTGQTYICLLNACAAVGRLDRVYAIVRDMTAAGLGLNKFCYAGLISAHKNGAPEASDTVAKILELVEQSKGWLSGDRDDALAENFMMGISEEELYNIPTAEFINRRGFVHKQLTVYHVASHAFAELRNVEALMALLEKDKKAPDGFITMQIMRCYLLSGNLDRGHQIFEDYMSRNPPIADLFVTLIEGSLTGYTPKGMQLAKETLENMLARNFFLNPKMANHLLLLAAGEKTAGYTFADHIWDLLQARKLIPALPVLEAYLISLKERETPVDDPRFILVQQTLDRLHPRSRSRPGLRSLPPGPSQE